MLIDKQLSAARAALGASALEAALKSIADAWRVVPAPELLELACALSPPDQLQAAKAKETAERLKAARKAKPDPRVSKALELLLTDVPWTADSSKPVWREAFALAAALKDPRWVSLAEALPKQWKFRAPMAKWMGAQLRQAVAPLAAQKGAPLSEAQREAVQALHALVPKKKKVAEANDGAALLAAVHAAPGDDAPRRVFADFLLEQGDPRGEFITLQLANKPETAKRMKQLLEAHGKRWLDGLAIAKNVTFHRGFLSKVKVTFRNQGEAEKYGALPAWATIEELELDSSNNALDQRTWGQTIPPGAVSLKRVSGLDGRGLEHLCALKQPLAFLESIEGYAHDFEQWRALTQSPLFPRLTKVELTGVKPAWLAKAPAPAKWGQRALGFVSATKRAPGNALSLWPSAPGRVLWADREGLLELDAEGKVVRDLAPARWSSAVFSFDGRQVFGGSDDIIEVFDTRTGERSAKLEVPCSTSYDTLCLSRDGKVLAAPMNPGVSVSWPGSGQKPAVYKGASCFALTPDGKFLIRCDLTWGKGAIQLHPVGEKARGVKFAEDSAEFTAVTCAPDGATFATANKENELQLWKLASRVVVKTFKGAKDVKRLAFSPDGQQLAVGATSHAWVFDVASGKKTVLTGSGDALAWTPDGTLLRAAKGKLLRS